MLLQIGFGTLLFITIIMTAIGFALTLCDDPLAELVGALILVVVVIVTPYYLHQKPSEPQTMQETESEDLSQPVTNMENAAYANGEVIEKLNNSIIQVSVHGETYKILVEQNVYLM